MSESVSYTLVWLIQGRFAASHQADWDQNPIYLCIKICVSQQGTDKFALKYHKSIFKSKNSSILCLTYIFKV